MVRRRSSSAAAASERASASAWPYSTMVAMPRTRSRKRACSRASARNWLREAAAAPMPATAIATGTSRPHRTSTRAPVGSASRAASATSSGAADRQGSGRQPAGVEAVQRLDAVHDDRGQLAGVVSAQPRRTGMQQARQRVGPQPPPRRRPCIERGALGSDRQGRAEDREHREASQPVQACRRPGRPGRRRAASRRTTPGPRPCPCRAGLTGRPAIPPGCPPRRSSRSQARDAVLLCSDCIVAPLSPDDARRTERAA